MICLRWCGWMWGEGWAKIAIQMAQPPSMSHHSLQLPETLRVRFEGKSLHTGGHAHAHNEIASGRHVKRANWYRRVPNERFEDKSQPTNELVRIFSAPHGTAGSAAAAVGVEDSHHQTRTYACLALCCPFAAPRFKNMSSSDPLILDSHDLAANMRALSQQLAGLCDFLTHLPPHDPFFNSSNPNLS
jgi:hypothetical protein